MREVRTVGYRYITDVEFYNGCKYSSDIEVFRKPAHFMYNDVEKYEIVTREDAATIEAETDSSGIDDYHEYLVLHFKDGRTATFRNSYVDLFFIGKGGEK